MTDKELAIHLIGLQLDGLARGEVVKEEIEETLGHRVTASRLQKISRELEKQSARALSVFRQYLEGLEAQRRG